MKAIKIILKKEDQTLELDKHNYSAIFTGLDGLNDNAFKFYSYMYDNTTNPAYYNKKFFPLVDIGLFKEDDTARNIRIPTKKGKNGIIPKNFEQMSKREKKQYVAYEYNSMTGKVKDCKGREKRYFYYKLDYDVWLNSFVQFLHLYKEHPKRTEYVIDIDKKMAKTEIESFRTFFKNNNFFGMFDIKDREYYRKRVEVLTPYGFFFHSIAMFNIILTEKKLFEDLAKNMTKDKVEKNRQKFLECMNEKSYQNFVKSLVNPTMMSGSMKMFDVFNKYTRFMKRWKLTEKFRKHINLDYAQRVDKLLFS